MSEGKREVLVRIEYHGQVWYEVKEYKQETMGKTHARREDDTMDLRGHHQQVDGRQGR